MGFAGGEFHGTVRTWRIILTGGQVFSIPGGHTILVALIKAFQNYYKKGNSLNGNTPVEKSGHADISAMAPSGLLVPPLIYPTRNIYAFTIIQFYG